MIQIKANEGKALKYTGEEVQFAHDVYTPDSLASMWVEVDESEYITWQAEQEKKVDLPLE